jgi:hypothetical protein
MRRIPTLLGSAVLLHALACSAAPEKTLEDALVHYEAGRYEEAFAAFAELADEGHCEAARIAREMMRFGTELYARDFVLPQDRPDRWPQGPTCLATGMSPRR